MYLYSGESLYMNWEPLFMEKKQPVQWNDKYVLNDTHLGRSQALRGLKFIHSGRLTM